MVWELCFPNSRSGALAFFPHQHVPPLVTFRLKFQLRRLLRRGHNYTSQFVFGQAKSWRRIPLHSSCIMQEIIFCLPDWVKFSNYHNSESFHCCKMQVASVQNRRALVEYVHFSPHDKVHLDIFEHLALIGSRYLLLASYKLTFEPYPLCGSSTRP